MTMENKTILSDLRERVEVLKKIGREYGRGKGSTELSKEMNMSKQRILQIVIKLRKKGIDIPRLRYDEAWDIAIKELKEEK